MYPSTSLFIAIGQLAIVALVMFSYPLQVHPCRNCLDKVFHPEHVRTFKTGSDNDEAEGEDEVEPGGDEHGHHGQLSTFKHFVFTTVIVFSGFAIAFLVNDLKLGTCAVRFFLPCFILTDVSSSSIFSGRYWIHDNFLHSARIILLEGEFFLSPIMEAMR